MNLEKKGYEKMMGVNDKVSESVSVAEAARIMGASQEFVRQGLQQKIFTFGEAVKMHGKQKYTYYISRKRLEKYLDGSI
jgi:hypothetical protein